MANEDIFVGVIVAKGGHPTDIIVEREAAETAANFVRRAFAEIGDEMRRVRGAAAVAENKNLPVFFQGLTQLLQNLRDRFDGNGIEGGLLRLEIVVDPALHGFNMAEKICQK